mgnify:FL=1
MKKRGNWASAYNILIIEGDLFGIDTARRDSKNKS